MKALTIKQFWLYAITDLDKRIENRSWPPYSHVIGRRIALHASQSIDLYSKGEIYRICPNAVLLPKPNAVPTGAIVATAVITGYVEHGGSADKWFVGPYGWLLDDVMVLPNPQPCSGQLGLWAIPDEIEDYILREVAYQEMRK